MSCRTDGSFERSRSIIAIGYSSSVLFLLLASAFFTTVGITTGQYPVTRSGPFYSGSIDGEGDSGDLILAGSRYYDLAYDFSGTDRTSLYYVNISKVNIEPPLISTPMISCSVADGSARVVGDLDVSVGGCTVEVNSTELISLNLEVIFHLNWSDPETRIKLIPYLDYGSGPIQVQPQDEVAVTVWGRLDKPLSASIKDRFGKDLSDGSVVASNSTISIDGVRFIYWHSSEDLSGSVPLTDEVKPFITDGSSTFDPDPGTSFNFTLRSPNTSQGEWELTMGLYDIHQNEWPIRVQMWSLTLKLDGYGPSFELTAPSGRVGEGKVNWTVSLSERPVNLLNLVNGSSLKVRVGTDDEAWSEWAAAGAVPDGRAISIQGSSNMSLSGYKHIQFMASDILGNSAVSIPFDVELNHPPSLSVPIEYRDLIMRSDRSIELNGINFTVDEDDDRESLIYVWMFDGELVGSGKTITKPLFAESAGPHNITLFVSDSFTSKSISFNIDIKKVETPKEKFSLKDLIDDPVFQVIGSSILAILVIVLISALIIVIVRRLGRTDDDDSDFIISEDANRNNEDIARKLHDMYSGNFTVVGPDGSASAYEDMSGEEFDFDYNLYEILGLQNNASDEEIKSAYRKLAAYYHPDRVTHHKEIDEYESKETMVQINKAKEFLMNPERKARYDEHLSELDFSIET